MINYAITTTIQYSEKKNKILKVIKIKHHVFADTLNTICISKNSVSELIKVQRRIKKKKS